MVCANAPVLAIVRALATSAVFIRVMAMILYKAARRWDHRSLRFDMERGAHNG